MYATVAFSISLGACAYIFQTNNKGLQIVVQAPCISLILYIIGSNWGREGILPLLGGMLLFAGAADVSKMLQPRIPSLQIDDIEHVILAIAMGFLNIVAQS